MKKLLPILLFALPVCLVGQSVMLAPTVIDAGGSYKTAGNFNLSDNVGEPVTTTEQIPTLPSPAAFFLTQGFEQPRMVASLNFSLAVNNETCIKSGDGSAALNISGGIGPYTVVWSADSVIHTTSIDSLKPGNYTVTVKDANGLTTGESFVVLAGTAECQVKFYNGITPNGDGHDDTWIIENITLFPGNDVQIYNRWGTEVWSAHDYDNNRVVWKGNDYQNQPLPDGTYYYLVTIPGAAPMKGWVELTR